MEEIKKGVLQAFITNLGKYCEGVLVGEWVRFPATSEELQNVFERIGIGQKNTDGEIYSKFFITDYDYEIELPGLSKLLGEYESLDELNYFASLIAAMSDEERNQLQAAFVLAGYTGGLKDFINLAQNLDCYNLYPDILTMEDLGRHYLSDRDDIPEDLIDYVDYEDYGRDASINENGVFTSYGYVAYNNSKFVDYYDGKKESIPEEYRITVGTTSPEQVDTDETTLRINSLGDDNDIDLGSETEPPVPSSGRSR